MQQGARSPVDEGAQGSLRSASDHGASFPVGIEWELTFPRHFPFEAIAVGARLDAGRQQHYLGRVTHDLPGSRLLDHVGVVAGNGRDGDLL